MKEKSDKSSESVSSEDPWALDSDEADKLGDMMVAFDD